MHLLGGFSQAWSETPLSPIASLPARSLFAYLITHRDRPHTRDLLAGICWPDLSDTQARRRLSQALWQIGRVLQPLASTAPYLLADAKTVQFNAASAYWLDVHGFEQRAVSQLGKQANKEPRWQELVSSSTDIPDLRAAVGLYRGDFMAGFYDDWILSPYVRRAS